MCIPKWTDTVLYLQVPGKTSNFLFLIYRNLVKEMMMVQNTGISYSRQQNGMGCFPHFIAP
jgi:hypothetical protein